MRKLVVSEFVSLDGVIEAPGGEDDYVHGPWTLPYFCDEVREFKSEELLAADALLLGRVQYEGFSAAWPERSGDLFSDRMNSMEKYVVSSTLTDPTWNNTHVLSGDMATEVQALRDGEGGDILVAGSATLVRSLLEADLVDELRLAIYPLTLGSGKKMFPAASHLHFDVVDVSATSTGVILATHRRGEAPPPVEFDYDELKPET